MASAKSIVDLRKDIQSFLEEGFDRLSLPEPFILIGTFPGDNDAIEALEKKAKARADNGFILITCETIEHKYDTKRPGGQGLRAEIIYPIYIISNDRNGDEKLVRLWETTRDILFRKLGYIYDGGFPPVQFGDSGLHVAVLRAGESNVYDGEGYSPMRRF